MFEASSKSSHSSRKYGFDQKLCVMGLDDPFFRVYRIRGPEPLGAEFLLGFETPIVLSAVSAGLSRQKPTLSAPLFDWGEQEVKTAMVARCRSV